MNERRLKQLNIVVVMAILAGLIFISLFVFVFAPDGQNRITGDTIKDFNDGWILKAFAGGNDEIVTLPVKLKADESDIIVLSYERSEAYEECRSKL